jgi:hypothetical protein
MGSSGMLRLVALVRTDVSEERSASIIRVTGIGELGTLLSAETIKKAASKSTNFVKTLRYGTFRKSLNWILAQLNNSVFK